MHPARPQGARRSSRGTVRSARPRTRIMSTAATISSAPRPARRATSSSRPGHRGLTPGATVEPCAVSDDLDALQGALLRWYGRERRDLPWRRTTDPYAILVSEVMLQQTQVARVVPRYLEWIARWPTAAVLAAASRADVLAAWVGLGYNRRALALHAAAEVVARDGWPADLRTLPGVGPYTAAAVGSFAFGAPVAAVDTNVRRVLSRHDGRHHAARELAARAGALVPPGRAAAFDQAMMELGATICTPGRPRCE